MQYTSQRVYSKRDQFKTLTSMNIARDYRNRIIHRSIELIKAIYALYMHVHTNDVVIPADGAGSADESKRTKLVQGWSRQIMGRGFYYLQYYRFLK